MSLLKCLPILALSILFCACSNDGERKAGAGRAPLPVTVAKAKLSTVPLQLKLFGTVEAKAAVPVKARVSGQLLRVYFREGDEVGKGAPLFAIDPRPFELAVQQAEAAYACDRAQQLQARQQQERFGKLLSQGFVSQSEYDQVLSSADALDAVLASDQAAIAAARLQLDYCTIRAPLAGRTGSLLADPGVLVKADDVPLVVIHQLQPIDVTFAAPEKSFAALQQALRRNRLQVTALVDDAAHSAAEQGTLDFVDNAVDSATGTIRLKATFANTARRLWPGAFVRVSVDLGALVDVVTVPAAAVQSGQGGEFLFVVRDDGKVEQRPVRTGTSHDGLVVIDAGLTAGETVVTDGQMRLFPGAQVKPVEASAAPVENNMKG